MLFNEGLKTGLGLEAHVPGHFLAVFQDDDAGNAGNTVLHGQVHVFIHIDAVEGSAALHGIGHVFQDGSQHFAGAAPFGGKIQHGGGLLQGIGQVVVGNFLDHGLFSFHF